MKAVAGQFRSWQYDKPQSRGWLQELPKSGADRSVTHVTPLSNYRSLIAGTWTHLFGTGTRHWHRCRWHLLLLPPLLPPLLPVGAAGVASTAAAKRRVASDAARGAHAAPNVAIRRHCPCCRHWLAAVPVQLASGWAAAAPGAAPARRCAHPAAVGAARAVRGASVAHSRKARSWRRIGTARSWRCAVGASALPHSVADLYSSSYYCGCSWV